METQLLSDLPPLHAHLVHGGDILRRDSGNAPKGLFHVALSEFMTLAQCSSGLLIPLELGLLQSGARFFHLLHCLCQLGNRRDPGLVLGPHHPPAREHTRDR